MVTFDELIDAARHDKVGIIVKNCAPSSVKEAEAAIKNYPDMEVKITKTKDAGTCVAICPSDYHPDEAVKAAGLAGLFRRHKR